MFESIWKLTRARLKMEDLRRFGMVARGVRAFSNIAKLKLKLIDKFSVRKQLSIFESLRKYISRR